MDAPSWFDQINTVSCSPPCSRLFIFLYLPLPLRLSGSYEAVSREVLAESALTANDPFKQFAISFFDNKFNSLIPLKIAYFLRRVLLFWEHRTPKPNR